ncbi:P-loop containing nucleoside triphosphate hydrolase protein [Delphinella strobiligena]|nr:P-loop containing nucleoside triphosphate hydrolase protein [Delphinella strobiligena]
MASTDACEWSAAEVAAYVRDGRLREDIAWIPHVPDFDTHALASQFEAEGVIGCVLLTGINMQTLKDDFGIRNMSVRTVIVGAINRLRQNSRLFSKSGQGNDIVSASLPPSEATSAAQEPLECQLTVEDTSIGTNTRGVEYTEQDAFGRKRRKLNLLEPASGNNATTVMPPDPAVVTDSEDVLLRDLPEKFTAIDTMFYGNTPYGGEINLELPKALKADTFSIIADSSRNPDEVLATASRMKRFLNARKDNITFHGRPAIAIKPYPDATPKGRRRKPRVDQILPNVLPHSITVVQEQSNGKATAMRMDSHKLHLHKHENVDVSEHASQYSYLLDKYCNMEDDELLPTLEDDNQSITSSLEAEIEQEQDDTTAAGRCFTQYQARQIINEAIDAITNAWKEKNLPILEKNKAWGLWRSTRGRRSIRDIQIETVQNRIQYLQTRLNRAIEEILLSTWSSKIKLTKQCDSIDVTVEDIAEQTWKIEVLQRKEEPDHVVHATKRTAPRAKDSGKSAQKTTSFHDDFIVEDLPARDSESVLVEDDRLDLHYQKKSIDEELLKTADDGSPSAPVINNEEDAPASVSRLASDLPSILHTDESQQTQSEQEVETDTEHVELKDENDDHESDDDLPSLSKLTRPTQPAREEQPPHEVIVLSSDTPSPEAQSPNASSSKAPMTKTSPLLVLSDERKLEIYEYPLSATIDEIKSLTWNEVEVDCPSKEQLLLKLVYEMDSDRRKILFPYICRGSISACNKDVTSIINDFPLTPGPFGDRSENESLAMICAARLYLCWCEDDSDFWTTHTPSECIQYSKPGEYNDASFRRWHNILVKALQKAERVTERVITVMDDSDEADEAKLVTKKGKKRVVRKDKSAEKLRKQALQRQEDLPQQTSYEGKVSQMIAAGRLDGDEVALFAPHGTDPSQHVYLNKHFSQKFLPHQVQGVRFMWRELTVPGHKGGQGAILSHTMGLGKTAQAIGLLVTVAETLSSEQKRILIPESMREQRVLILCPPGLIINWKEELTIWDSDNALGNAHSVDSDDANSQHRIATLRAWKAVGGILLIGYRMFQTFISGGNQNRAADNLLSTQEMEEITDILLKVPTVVIADEAHVLSNQGSKVSLAAKKIVTQRRIGLTATPMSNNIQEIFSLISWAAPNYLGSADEFKAFWTDPIEKGAFKNATKDQMRRSIKKLAGLYEVIAPKLDRAGSEILEKELPPKVEFVMTLPLTDLQTQVYTTLVKQRLDTASGGNNDNAAPLNLFGWLSTVGLLFGHPWILRQKLLQKGKQSPRQEPVPGTHEEAEVDTHEEGDVEIDENLELGNEEQRDIVKMIPETWNVKDSNKAWLVRAIIDKAIEEQDKALIFSQSIPALDYLMDLLRPLKCKIGRIDGSFSQLKRDIILSDMKKGRYDVLIISTKAGSLGINLQIANRVVVFDFGFNPSWETQAIARCYRLGQKKSTFVYRFVAGGTSEEVLHDKALFKTLLASRVVDKKNPERNAKREPREWLALPGLIPQEDITGELGKDPAVLDRILAEDGGSSSIRSIKTVETLSKEADDQPLTEAEKREVEAEIAFSEMMAGKGEKSL